MPSIEDQDEALQALHCKGHYDTSISWLQHSYCLCRLLTNIVHVCESQATYLR